MNTQQSNRNVELGLRGKTAPGDEDFKKILPLIFGPEDRQSVKFTIEAAGNEPEIAVHCIAKHADIISVLSGELKDKVDLSHYDDLLEASADDVRFFLGKKSDDQDKRWEILRQAMKLDTPLRRGCPDKSKDEKRCPYPVENDAGDKTQQNSEKLCNRASDPKQQCIDTFDKIARQATADANAFHFTKLPGPGQFNAVREYGYFIPYLAAKEYVGIEVPQKPSLLLKIFTFFRNRKSRGKVRLDGDLASASQMLLWSHVVFGHLFANIGGRNKMMNFAAPKAANGFNKRIEKCLREDFEAPDGSLIDRFRKVRRNFADMDNAEYERHVRSIIFEFSGAMQILVGTSFANILSVIYDHDLGLDNFLALIEAHGDRVLDEALRLKPTTTSVYRVARESFNFGDQIVQAGDMICLLTGAACTDPRAFSEPDTFSLGLKGQPKRDPSKYINFGPAETIPNTFNPADGTHPCFGQYWARSLLKSMLKGLSQFDDLKIEQNDGSVLSNYQFIPDAIIANFKKPQVKTQNFVTVCSEIKRDKLPKLNVLREIIEKLGNPASSSVREKLDECGCIHFMSLNIVEGDLDKNEPAILFLEMSVDGEKEQALKSLSSHLWNELKEIYSGNVHGKIETPDQLFEHLSDNSVEMIQSVWPQFYSGNWRNGLGFSGTPGLSIQQIKDERIIAEYVAAHIGHSDASKTPQQVLSETRDALAKEEAGEIARAKNRWIDKDSKPPIFAEVAGSPWKSAWSKATLTLKATPVVVKVWAVALYFLIGGVIWNQLGQYPSLKDHANFETAWKFPSNLLPPDGATSIYISAFMLLTGILLAFAFAIIISWISVRFLRLRAGKIGAIFAFISFMVFFVALAPNSMSCGLSNPAPCDNPYIPVLFGKYLVNSTIWIYALVATLVLAATTFLFDRRSFWKSASALVAFGLMTLLVLTIGDLQLDLMATNNDIAALEGRGFAGFSVINRWNMATPLQMFFYPVAMSTIVASAVFAFNASYPQFSLFTSRRIYKILFVLLFAFFFITTFYSPTLPTMARLGTFSLAYFLSIPATLIAVGILAGIVWQILRRSETKNTPVDEDPDVDNLATMLDREDVNGAHNHMISVQNLLPQQWRLRFFLPLALHLVLIVLLKNRYRPGFLAAVGTVHYARWIHIAKTNKFVFVSNYDGSWESYLEDFITKSATGMTGIWSNCIGFPQAKNLFFEGAVDGDRFKRWARKSMQPTSFWYSAYPDIGAQEIRRNTLIRDGLARITSPSDAEAWIDLNGSIPRPTFALQSEKIQSIVFGGSGNLKAGRCLIVRSNVEGGIDPYFRDWVLSIKDQVSFGDTPPQNQAVYVGFSGKGMGLLGCNKGLTQEPGNPESYQPDCTKFPPAFLMGMDSNSRASVLGDLEGDNRSCRWNWGNDKKPGHAFLLIYGETTGGKNSVESPRFKKVLAAHKKLIDEHKLKCEEIKLENLPETGPLEEPFGYADGISQPLVRGTRRAAQRADSVHAVNPGEFILGYKDNRDFYPPSPQVSAHVDEDALLPAIARSQPQRYPRFQSDAEEKFRDLGRNGTYLVIRQLEQNVKAFEKAVTDNSKKFKNTAGEKSSDMIKAKLMGRWPDGTPLIKRPVKLMPADPKVEWVAPKSSRPLNRSDNEFLYGKEDPQGHKCPYGSHIRRTNPRDGLDVENSDGLSIVNRHRILRRGRVYKHGAKKGTFFMCLNADIERQFEFIQQTWINSCTFHGLTDEMDPITGQGYAHIDPTTQEPGFKSDNFKFTVQDSDRTTELDGFKPFVTVRGGGYFFVPGKDALEFIAQSADNPLLAKCPDQKKA